MMSSFAEKEALSVDIEVIDNLTSSKLTGASITAQPGVIVEGGLGNFVLKSNNYMVSELILEAPGYVTRQTSTSIPSDFKKIGLIPNSFDMASFNKMARNSPKQADFRPVGQLSMFSPSPTITIFDKKTPFSESETFNSVGTSLSSSSVTALANKAQTALNTLSPFSATPYIETPTVGQSKTYNGNITVVIYTGMLSAKGWAGVCWTYVGMDGRVLYAHIGIDSGYENNTNVMIHEFGHALGLNHVTISSIMYPSVGNSQFVSKFDTDSRKIIYDRWILNSIPDNDPPTTGFFSREFASTSDMPPTETITDGYEYRIGCGMDGTEEMDVFRVSGTSKVRVGGYARRKCQD